MGSKDGGVSSGTGGISILAIFVVLCLTTLATLSLVSARADLALSRKTVKATSQYYTADMQAEEKLAELMKIVDDGGDWVATLEQDGFEVVQQDEKTLVSYSVVIDEYRDLHVGISLFLDQDGMPTGQWERERWQTKVAEAESSSAPINVLK